MKWIKAISENPRNFVKATVKTHAISYMDDAENQPRLFHLNKNKEHIFPYPVQYESGKFL